MVSVNNLTINQKLFWGLNDRVDKLGLRYKLTLPLIGEGLIIGGSIGFETSIIIY